PGASGAVNVSMTGFGLPPGAYEGFIHVLGTNSGIDQRVPYWYGIGSTVPERITVLYTVPTPKAGAFTRDAANFRITDKNGITVRGVTPKATVVSGGGSVQGIANEDSFYPGVYGLNVTLGAAAGSNVFHIAVGNVTQDVTIVSQ